MSRSAFVDKVYPPSETDIATVLGPAYANWNSMLEEIHRAGRTQEELKFLYGKPYGWGIRFKLKSKLLAALYPNQSYFVVQIILGLEQLKEVEHIRLHSNATEAIRNANPYPEGKWLFVKVEGKRDIEDVRELLKLKMKTI